MHDDPAGMLIWGSGERGGAPYGEMSAAFVSPMRTDRQSADTPLYFHGRVHESRQIGATIKRWTQGWPPLCMVAKPPA